MIYRCRTCGLVKPDLDLPLPCPHLDPRCCVERMCPNPDFQSEIIEEPAQPECKPIRFREFL